MRVSGVALEPQSKNNSLVCLRGHERLAARLERAHYLHNKARAPFSLCTIDTVYYSLTYDLLKNGQLFTISSIS